MTVYESVIEIWLEPTLSRFEQHQKEFIPRLRALRRQHNPASGFGGVSQERGLLDLLWQRTCFQNEKVGSSGLVESFTNCAFKLLYGVFGTDTIRFLFDKHWVPKVTIEPFYPTLFLERLAILEQAAQKLQDGAKTPIRLRQTAPFVRTGMGPKLERFEEQKHRILLDASLRELRDFGELGQASQQPNENLRVGIQIWEPYGGVIDPEILNFSVKP